MIHFIRKHKKNTTEELKALEAILTDSYELQAVKAILMSRSEGHQLPPITPAKASEPALPTKISAKRKLEILQALINSEDKRNPLKDTEIKKKFFKMGYEVSKNTVYQYRKMLKIPNAYLRQKASIELKNLIDGENKQNPLSDNKIRLLFQSKGYKLSSRMICDYRKELNIPCFYKRADYWGINLKKGDKIKLTLYNRSHNKERELTGVVSGVRIINNKSYAIIRHKQYGEFRRRIK